MKKIEIVVRYLLALVYLVFGLNYFLHFIPMPPMSGTPGTYMGILFTSNYLLIVKILEVSAGVLLALNLYTRLAALILLPISVNILLFHVLIAGNPAMSIVILLLNVALLYFYAEDLKGIFRKK